MESQFCITEVADLPWNVRPLLAHTVCSESQLLFCPISIFFFIFQSDIEKLVPYTFVADTKSKMRIFSVSSFLRFSSEVCHSVH